MKKIQQITSLFLILVITNVFVGKTIHELFFHHEGVHCDAVNQKHFHATNFVDADLICTFHFSALSSSILNSFSQKQLFYFNQLVVTQFNFFAKTVFQVANALRGPPLA